MYIAFLFNSDHPSLGGWYGGSVLEMILKTGELQQSARQMRVMVGDILTFSVGREYGIRTCGDWALLTAAVVRPAGWSQISAKKLSDALGTCTIYCWVFQNMDAALAERVAKSLSRRKAYLGAIEVDFSNELHLRFFRNCLIEKYRLDGPVCTQFYPMGENEDPDLAVSEYFEKNGFRVEYEDMGARRTIFDNYDSLEHFRRVADFARTISALPRGSECLASDVTFVLEELHPRLFDALAACVRAYARSETEEDLAQVALSGRRFLESIADALFPPSEERFEGRLVTKEKYRNRLWAYLKVTMVKTGKFEEQMFVSMGKEVDRLIDLFNSALHARISKDRITEALVDLVSWIRAVADLDRGGFRQPYLAYRGELVSFAKEIIDGQKDK